MTITTTMDSRIVNYDSTVGDLISPWTTDRSLTMLARLVGERETQVVIPLDRIDFFIFFIFIFNIFPFFYFLLFLSLLKT